MLESIFSVLHHLHCSTNDVLTFSGQYSQSKRAIGQWFACSCSPKLNLTQDTTWIPFKKSGFTCEVLLTKKKKRAWLAVGSWLLFPALSTFTVSTEEAIKVWHDPVPVPYWITSLTLSVFIQGQRVCIDPSSDKHFPSANCCAKPIRQQIKLHNHNQRLDGREILHNLQSQPQI